MGFMDKISNRFKMGKGTAKQKTGKATGNRRLQAKGHTERAGAAGRQHGEQVKDDAKSARGVFKR